MSHFLRQLWRQKPDAWGPVEAVQRSLRINVEKIGINPVDLATAIPMWSPGDQRDYAKDIPAININAVCDQKSLYFNGTINNYLTLNTSDSLFLGELSIFVVANIAAGFYQRQFCCKVLSNGATNNPFDFRTNDEEIPTLSLVRANTKYKWHTGPPVILGKTTLYSVLCDKEIAESPMFGIDSSFQISTIKVGGGSGMATGANANIKVGVRPDNTSIMIGHIASVVILSKKVSPEIGIALSDHPYQLWHRVPDVYYSLPLAPPGAGGVVISCSTASVTISGFPAAVSVGTGIQCGTGDVSMTGINAAISAGTGITASTGMVSIAGNQAAISTGITINAGTGAVSAAGVTASIETGTAIICSTADLVIAGVRAEVLAGTAITASTGQVAASGVNASVSLGAEVRCQAAGVSVSGVAAEVVTGQSIQCSSGGIACSGINAFVSTGVSISCNAAGISISAPAAQILVGTGIQCSTGGLSIAGPGAAVLSSHLVECSTGRIGISSSNVTISVNERIFPAERTTIIRPENRTIIISAENRTTVVA